MEMFTVKPGEEESFDLNGAERKRQTERETVGLFFSENCKAQKIRQSL